MKVNAGEGSLESRVASLEGQFQGPWTSAEGTHSDTTADRLVQLELQVKGLMRWVNYVNHVHDSAKEDVPEEPAPSPEQFIESTRATLDNQRRKSRRLNSSLKSKAPPPSPGFRSLPKPSQSSTRATRGTERYSYVSLHEAISEIRVLALRSSNDPREPLQGRLVTMSLDHRKANSLQWLSNSFATLSYTWGNLAKTEHILIDQKRLNITISLYQALMRLRELESNLPYDERPSLFETYWWIDAICINQDDIDERSSQVRVMTRLYKHSKITHVWLGEESSDSAQALALIRKLAYEPEQGGEECKTWEYMRKPGQVHRPGGPGRPDIELPVEFELSDREKEANRSAITSFYQRPWWSRVWVRQEVALTDYVTFHCGRETISWYKVMKAAQILSLVATLDPGSGLGGEVRTIGNAQMSCFEVATSLQAIRSQTGASHSDYVSLDSLLAYSRNCQSQDAKDKVYAMLGLTDPDKITLVPDYRKSTEELYTETALEMLRSGIDFFRLCHNQNLPKTMSLPSWVPNLSMPLQHVPVEIESGAFGTGSMLNVFSGPLEFAYSQHESCLNIKGAVFDSVSTIATSSTSDYTAWYDFYTSTGGVTGDWDFSFPPDHYCHVYKDKKRWEESIIHPLLRSNSKWGRGPFNTGWNSSGSSLFGAHSQPFTFGSSNEQPSLFGSRSNDIQPWQPISSRDPSDDPHVRLAQQLLSSRPRIRAREDSSSNNKANTPFDICTSSILSTNAMEGLAKGRRLILSERGALALAPIGTKIGDKFCLLQGSGYAYVIRKVNQNTYELVGQLCKFEPLLYLIFAIQDSAIADLL